MVQLCALASGSNGNCYYVGNEHEAVLIDMGLSHRQLTQRLRDAGLSIRKVKALFISHEHTDHIKGMRIVADKSGIEAYATKLTYEKARKDFRSAKVNFFAVGESISVGSIKVHAFGKLHDAADPVGFRVEIEGKHIAVITDLGTACEKIREQLKNCEAVFLETNYEHNLLMGGKYPIHLKKRISSDYGHLSNQQAFELVQSLNGSPLKTIFLSHISADNNRVELAMNTFKPFENSHQLIATSRYAASQVIEL
ncbi:MAG: MBL fold metallo-hydrolase [Bacteroidetes bacterium HGW-Bacteroidetes-4]|nr:MAG: MBL fold metallo-hydrolase [Bacteroidetes bacterium HGW-Bacteroidetes-4]